MWPSASTTLYARVIAISSRGCIPGQGVARQLRRGEPRHANVSMGDKRMTWQLDATALSALLDAREITPLQLLDQALARLDALEPVLNAFTHVDRDGALAAAKAATARQASGTRLGPLDGIPVSVKDNIFVAGLPARWGSLLFRDHVPDRDDICVERLRAAGAVIVGKTTTPELAMLGRTDSRLSGITRSPWDPALTPGGSSGGASASVAAGVTTARDRHRHGRQHAASGRLYRSRGDAALDRADPPPVRISGHLYRLPGHRPIRPDHARHAAAVRCARRPGPARPVLATVSAGAGCHARPSPADRLVHRDRR